MTDLAPDFYRRVSTLLEAQRAAIARYGHLLDGQRAALRGEDLELVADLAGQAAELVQGLEEASRHLGAIACHLVGRQGDRSEAVREMMLVVAVELEQALAQVRQFAEVVELRKAGVLRGLRELDGDSQPRPGKSFRPPTSGPNFLDRSG